MIYEIINKFVKFNKYIYNDTDSFILNDNSVDIFDILEYTMLTFLTIIFIAWWIIPIRNIKFYKKVIKMAEIKNININDLTKMITIKVSITGYRKYNLKMYIGKLLIKSGIWVMNVNGEIEVKNKEVNK